jgi:catechol 2,3-dioxygenase-like lactoylglutathione lyase family enzyme
MHLLESALYVDSLARSRDFYRPLLAARVLLEDERLCALSVADRQVLLLFRTGGSVEPSETPGGTIPAHDGRGPQHIAFGVTPDELAACRKRLDALGVAIESTVHPPRGGTSVYFRDPDGHLVEFATPGLWEIW